MSMFVGLRSCGDCAHTVTSSPAGTVKMSSGTRRGAFAARRGGSAAAAHRAASLDTRSADRATRAHDSIYATSNESAATYASISACSPALPGVAIAVLHAEHAVEPLAPDVPEEIPVVHLARARLLAARVVADLEIRDLAPRVVDVRDDVALVALHVVHVVEDLARRAIYRAADRVRLVRGAQEQVRDCPRAARAPS